MKQLVECVPNISEGRDQTKIAAIVDAARSVEGVTILDVDPGADTNRTVITFVGEPEPVLEAAFRLIKKSAELIDMRKHQGAHPRMGATDVCPFIPVSEVSMAQCGELARRLGQRVGAELAVPVYLYERAATRPTRQNLADVRRGEYEGLPAKLAQADWAPDFGPTSFSPNFGAAIIGARPFLIAYNVNLNTRSKALASEIALKIREQGSKAKDAAGNFIKDAAGEFVLTPGRLKSCKAVGWYIPEYHCAQISINLTDFTVTGMHDAFEACVEEATKLGLRVTGSELVGLVPREALLQSGRYYLMRQGAYLGVPQERLIESAVRSLGLSELNPFIPKSRIIEDQLSDPTPLADLSNRDFINEVASDSVAPGGGSVAALAGSLAAALTNMVCGLTYAKKKLKPHHEAAQLIGSQAEQLKHGLLQQLDSDTAAFNGVVAALRAIPKNSSPDAPEYLSALAAVDSAYKLASAIPLAVAESALDTLTILNQVAEFGLATALSDLSVATAMADAALYGASCNVRINLKEIKDQAFISHCTKRLSELDQARHSLRAEIEQKLTKRGQEP